ncbi:WD40 repeat domain-containing serine/threonine protein kinase [Nonomuraea sp. NPDC046570]|uniref:WD40 repeat domain-containing serine/threonine protein kinase n=1 Tax=Nonomuraea sp. NPDC046570 TaxID=3155255 RepID=UPI00340350DC
MRLLPGDPERLGHYWLAGRLGTGGQGVVYDAYDDRGDRFAIKVLHGDMPAQLAKEARAAGRVASFCTVKVVEVGLEAARPYIVSEFVEGPNLREAVERAGVYGGDGLRRLATALATALTAVHEAGVVHRDLKPENVLLGPDGPRVIDFGVARTGEMSLTTTGFVAGTPTYMAPEVFTGERAGPSADVFAWGGVVLYAATGQDPFQAESLGGVMHRVLTVDPDLGALAEPLRSLVSGALAKSPGDRPAAKELLLGLLGSAEPGAGARLAAEIAPPPGLTGARPLGEVAEAAYASLTPAQQAAVPGTLLRMLGEQGVRPIAPDEADDQEVVARLTEAGLLIRHSIPVPPTDTPQGRLVATAGNTVGPVSAALFHAWPRLRGWVAAERDGLPLHGRLRDAALFWDRQGRKPADLYRGSALDSTLSWAATGRRHLGLNALERRFLDGSAVLARRGVRRRRVVTGCLAALLAVAVASTAVAVRQRGDLSRQLAEANARAVAARADSLRAKDPQAAMRLSVAAWRLAPVFEARTALQRSLAQPELRVFTDPEADAEAWYQLGDDGAGLVRWKGDQVRRWDVAAGRVAAEHTLPRAGGDLTALSDDGGTFAAGGDGRVRVWDVASGARVGADRPDGDPSLHAGGRVLAVAGSDRTRLYAVTGGAALLEVTDGEYAVSADGGWAATSAMDGQVELWDLRRRVKVRGHKVEPPVSPRGEAAAPPAAFTADGRLLAVGGDTGITLIDTATGEVRDERLDTEAPSRLLFSPDGRFLLDVGYDGVRLWRVADRKIRATFEPRDATGDYAFSADGRVLRYLAAYGSVVSLDLSGVVDATSSAVTEGIDDSAPSVLSPDGRLAATAAGGRTRLYDVAGHTSPGAIGAAGELAFNGDGSLLAISGSPVGLWDVTTRRRVAALDVGKDIAALALSPDGRTLAAALTERKVVQLWDVRGRRLIGTVASAGFPLAFAPDGRTLAVGGDLAQVPSGTVTRDPAGVGGTPVTAVSFSPDGATLGLGLSSGQIVVWDVRGKRRLGSVEAGSGGGGSVRFSPDGRLLAVDGEQIRLWETSSLREVGQVPIGQYPAGLAFSEDGGSLRSVLLDGSVQESPVEPALAARAVCARAGGSLDEAGWHRLIPETGYRDVC